jgi:hypothetical protein
MQKVLHYIEKNNLEIKLSFYSIIAVSGFLILMQTLFPDNYISGQISFYFSLITVSFCVIYIIFKKFNSPEFFLFPPVKFVFFYFLFQILVFNLSFTGHAVILNRQKYNELDDFIIETYDGDKVVKETLIEKIYKKLFK